MAKQQKSAVAEAAAIDPNLERLKNAAAKTDPSTKEALVMLSDEEDITVGRLSAGLDLSDFDAMPATLAELADEIDDDTAEAVEGDDDDDEPAQMFESPPLDDEFPTYRAALRRFQTAQVSPRVVRVDNDVTYGAFVCERAVKELERRVNELRQAFEEHQEAHFSEKHPGYRVRQKPMRQWDDIIGAAKAVRKIRDAKDAQEATDAFPSVPVDLPPFAQGKVKCWRDGNNVVCSMRFQAADGTMRIATAAAKPKVDATDVVGWAMRSGANPLTVLGVLPELAEVACGKRLVRDVANAALEAQRRADVVGMDDEPVLLVNPGDNASPPLAALMHTQQLADAGDVQAQAEMEKIRRAAATAPAGNIAQPMLAESSRRLAEGRQKKAAAESSFMSRYAQMVMVLA